MGSVFIASIKSIINNFYKWFISSGVLMIVKRHLDSLGIEFKSHKHPGSCNCTETLSFRERVSGVHTKSLFLKDKQSNNFILVVQPIDSVTDIKKVGEHLGLELRFATDGNLHDFLRLEPSYVSPFGLINDEYNVVQVVIYEDVWTAESVSFFPNRKGELFEISGGDFKKYMKIVGNKFELI